MLKKAELTTNKLKREQEQKTDYMSLLLDIKRKKF